jgi:hypothetical protein
VPIFIEAAQFKVSPDDALDCGSILGRQPLNQFGRRKEKLHAITGAKVLAVRVDRLMDQ